MRYLNRKSYMKNNLFFFLLIFPIALSAQREADCLAIGYCDFAPTPDCLPSYGSAIYKFNEDGIEYIEEYAGLNLSTDYSRAAFSDRHTGELIFASNGWRLVNRSGEVLAHKLWRDDIPHPGNTPDTTAVLNTLGPLFLNDPGDSTKAYLFYGQHYTQNYPGIGLASLDVLFTYAYLDIPTQSLISKGNVILDEHELTARSDMAACRHANGRDWWLIKPGIYDDENYIGILDPKGVSLEKKSYHGMQHRVHARTFTYFNQHGDKMLRFTPLYRELHAFDFDRCSGELSNLIVHDLSDSIVVGDWNACNISPDGSKFYFRRSNGGILQYDLETSEYTEIAQLGAAPQLTPNYKQILLSSRIITENDSIIRTLSTIYEPNKAGLECNFIMHTDTVLNITNFISPSCFANFRLGKIEGSLCDTVVSSVQSIKEKSIKVYPNPSNGILNVEFETEQQHIVNIYNMLGQRVFSTISNKKTLFIDLSSLNLRSGLLLLEAFNEKNRNMYRTKVIYNNN